MENTNDRKSKRSLPAWAVLTIITLVAAVCLGGTYQMTKDTIARRTAEEAEATRKALLPDAAAFEEAEAASLDSFYVGKTEGRNVGYVGVSTVQGFGGEVEVTVGTDADGKITGVRVGGPNFSETAGLGAKTKEPAFYEQFTGKTYPVNLKKDGGEIDAVTSATVTSSAVVRAVNKTIENMSETAGFHIDKPVSAIEELGNGSYGISGQGVTGAFPIVVNLDGAGAVQSVEVKDSESAMDGSYLSKVQGDPAFLGQFTGKTSVDASGFDTVSGATVSSNSIIESVGNVLLYVNDPAAYAAKQTSAPAAEPEKAEVSGSNGEFTVAAKGQTGTFDVTVTLDESGAVKSVTLGEASTNEDKYFLGSVKASDTFLAQFVGKSGRIDESEIDTVSGATVSSRGVLDAVNTVFASAAPAAPAAAAEGVTVTAKGQTGTFDVTVTLDESGAVKSVTLGEASTNEDKYFLGSVKASDTFLAQFVGKSGRIDESEIDTVSGATVSSRGVLDAVNTVLSSAAPAAPAETAPAEPVPEETAVPVPDASFDSAAIATVKARAKGVTGTFDVVVGLNSEGAVCSVELGDSDSEADYIYLKAVKENKAFLVRFIGKTEVIGENDFDTVSGATVSSRSVLAAVNAALASADDALQAAKVPVFERTIKAKGMTGTFDVTVGVNESGAVSGVALGESNSEADYLYLKAVRESEGFLSQFAGKKKAVSADEIDTISGATLSSRAVLGAVNTVLALYEENAAAEPQATPTAAPTVVPVIATTAEPTPEPVEEFNGASVKVKGETGTFGVGVTLDENGAVAGVEIGRSSSEADELYLYAVKNSESFLAQFIGRTTYISPKEIDTVSGATVSSLAVVEAVNTLAGFPEPETAPDSAEEKTTGPSAETETQPAAETTAPAAGNPVNISYITARGETGTFGVAVSLDENNTICGVEIGPSDSEADRDYLAAVKNSEFFLNQFIGKKELVSENDIDVVSGATVSSRAVIDAVNTVVTMANGGIIMEPTPAPTARPSSDPTAVPTLKPTKEPAAEPADDEPGVAAKGQTGKFKVTVSLDEKGAVAAIVIGETDSEADKPYLSAVKESETFLSQFIGKTGVISAEDIDTVSGATVSSNAVLDAVNTVLSSYETVR